MAWWVFCICCLCFRPFCHTILLLFCGSILEKLSLQRCIRFSFLTGPGCHGVSALALDRLHPPVHHVAGYSRMWCSHNTQTCSSLLPFASRLVFALLTRGLQVELGPHLARGGRRGSDRPGGKRRLPRSYSARIPLAAEPEMCGCADRLAGGHVPGAHEPDQRRPVLHLCCVSRAISVFTIVPVRSHLIIREDKVADGLPM